MDQNLTSLGVLVMMGHFSSTLASVSEATRSMVAAEINKIYSSTFYNLFTVATDISFQNSLTFP